MSDVKRFDAAEVGKHYDISCGMEESPIGDYVLHSDYVVLVSKAFELAKLVNEKCAQLKIAVEALENISDSHARYGYTASELILKANDALKELLRGE